MTIARRQLIDVSVTRWYHCMSLCPWPRSLATSQQTARRGWNKIGSAQIFAIGVGGFSLMSVKQRVDHIKAEDRTAELPAQAEPAAWRARLRQAVWRRACGCARSKIDAGWGRHEKECSRGFPSAVISF